MSVEGKKFTPGQQRWLDVADNHLDQLPRVEAWAPVHVLVGPGGEVVLARPFGSTLNIVNNLNLKSLSRWSLVSGEKFKPGTNVLSHKALQGFYNSTAVWDEGDEVVSPSNHANLWRARMMYEAFSYDELRLAGYRWEPGIVIIDDLTGPIHDAGDAFLRLCMQSARVVMNESGRHLVLDGQGEYIHPEGHPLHIPIVSGTPRELFGAVPHVIAWNSIMPVPVEAIEQAEAEYMASTDGRGLGVTHNDYTPHMYQWLCPDGVRVVGGDIRLGCWAGEGTTVMPSGYGNCDSVILGKLKSGAMVEGRLTGGAVCGYDAEIGGSFSFLGGITGNSKPTRVGDRFLGGAQGGVGIDLGDDCRIAPGCYVTAGSFCVVDGSDKIVRGQDVEGHSGMTFVPNVRSGVDAQYRILETRGAEPKDKAYLFSN